MNTDQTLLPDWETQSDELEQVHFTSEEQVILKGTALTTFEFGASMRLRHVEEKSTAEFGILLHYGESKRVRIYFNEWNGSWKLAVVSEGIAPVINAVLALPGSFRADQWHALSIIQQEEQLQLSLDDEYVLMVSETAQAAQPGLLVSNAAVDFAGVWQKELHF